jgi:hypothetical protein
VPRPSDDVEADVTSLTVLQAATLDDLRAAASQADLVEEMRSASAPAHRC